MKTKKSTGPRVRIVAFIDRYYDRKDPTQPRIHREPEKLVGYVLDVSVEVEFGSGKARTFKLLEHIGGERIYRTLKRAEEAVLSETGIKVRRMPRDKIEKVAVPRGPCICVAAFVGEFVLSDKPTDAVLEDSPMVMGRSPTSFARRRSRGLVLIP